ncbi:transcription factor SOX-30-like [Odontesthes bonariensis]
MQSVRGKNGHIKRPMNAFFVWAGLHRRAVQNAFPGIESKDISVQLGCIWSQLSEKQKRPYYEVALKLRDMHRQQFPDYEYCPKRRKCREPLASVQSAGQAAGQQQGSSVPFYFSPDQSNLLGVNIKPCPILVPHTVAYCPTSSFQPPHSANSCSMLHTHSSRCPFASSCLEGWRNHYHTHQQGGGICLGCLWQGNPAAEA